MSGLKRYDKKISIDDILRGTSNEEMKPLWAYSHREQKLFYYNGQK